MSSISLQRLPGETAQGALEIRCGFFRIKNSEENGSVNRWTSRIQKPENTRAKQQKDTKHQKILSATMVYASYRMCSSDRKELSNAVREQSSNTDEHHFPKVTYFHKRSEYSRKTGHAPTEVE